LGFFPKFGHYFQRRGVSFYPIPPPDYTTAIEDNFNARYVGRGFNSHHLLDVPLLRGLARGGTLR